MRSKSISGDTLGYLIEGQQRVISHCERLLVADDLPAEDRARLLRLRDEAEAQLAQLTFAEAA